MKEHANQVATACSGPTLLCLQCEHNNIIVKHTIRDMQQTLGRVLIQHKNIILPGSENTWASYRCDGSDPAPHQ